MTPTPAHIGLLGKAGAGKDTLAALLCERGTHFRRALADPVKEEIGYLLFAENDPLESRRRVEARKTDPAMRALLQAYGHGKRVFVWEQYWIDRLFQYVAGVLVNEPARRVVVPDVRYPNEFTALEAFGAVLIRIVRPDAGLAGDPGQRVTETLLDGQVAHYTIENTGKPEWMLDQFDMIMQAHAKGDPGIPDPAALMRHLAAAPGDALLVASAIRRQEELS